MDAHDPGSAFLTPDGAGFAPNPIAQGPWGATVSGHIMGGILGWAVERAAPEPDLQPARLTVDLLRPTLMEPFTVAATVRRAGKRIALIDGEVIQRGAMVARAGAVFLRRGEHPAGEVWTDSTAMPALPDDTVIPEVVMPFLLWAYSGHDSAGTLAGTSVEWEPAPAPKFVWVKEIRPLIDGCDVTPFTKAALAGDVTSALTHWGTAGLRYINADFTMSLSRLPEGEFIGLAAHSHHGHDGVASGAATVFDRRGPLGHSIAVALAQPEGSFRPPRHIGLR